MNQDKIGNFIKSIRLEKNLTQKEFADELGVTYQAVSKWENGKNVPDIGTMKLISEKFNVNIDDILNGQKQTPKKRNIYSILAIVVPVLFVLTGIIVVELLIYSNNDVEFKTIKSNCSDFKVTGIAAYNKDKTSISIPTVEFCGKEDKEEYKKINCKFYEINKKTKTEISTCKEENNTTLEDYLKNVNISVNNYSTICKNVSTSRLLIEIEAINKDNKTITYTIPIELKDDCK